MAVKDKDKLDLSKLSDLEKFVLRDYREDLEAHDKAIENFDAYEAMHLGQTYDAESKQTSNGLTDSMTSTIYLERAARVAGQLPEGEVKAFGKKDVGKGMFMDILRQKWIYPNANAQRSFKTKQFMLQYNSSMYGYGVMYYDLNVSPSGYFGPDCWLWNPRNFIPQGGMTSIADMDYCHALAYKSPQYFKDILEDGDEGGWDKQAIEEVIDIIKNKTRETDPKRDTLQNQNSGNQSMRQICMATRHEAGKKGRWITFLPDFGYKVIRNTKNPHKNNRIPFVVKPCIPDFSSFYNVGDFQKSMPMQFYNDGLDNFYSLGLKRNLYPATVVNAQTMIAHTIDETNKPGGIVQMNGPVSDIKLMDTSTAGLSTYQAAKGMAKGAIQSIAGTTDTRANIENSMDPGMGRTPQALEMIQARESTRDNQDRELLEEAMKELIDGMLSLIPTMSEKVPVDMYQSEVEEIMASHPDLEEMLEKSKESGLANIRMSDTEQQARFIIDPTKLGGLEYRFELQPNSTSKKTKEEQLTALKDYFAFLGTIQNVVDRYQEANGVMLNLEGINQTFKELADIPGLDNMFVPVPEQPEQAPQGESAQAPMEQPPTEQAPMAQPPVEQAPMGQAPVGQAPVMRPDGQPFQDPALAARAQQIMEMAR